MGFSQLRTAGRMLFTMIGLRKTVPSSMALMVPLGDFHCFFRPYSLTRSALGVMVAFLTPTPYCMIARAASIVT